MSNPIVIALDAMGGDHAPDMVLRGANIACERYRDVEFLLFGPEDELRPKLERLKLLRKKSTICHANSVVTNEMKPSVALRKGRDSSMRLALNAVKEGKAHASFSAGNTGALMAMAKLVLGMVDGIHRPAIASMVPTEKGESVMLDLGANLECSAKNLVQFAILGEVFSRSLFSWDAPSVGLLNVGSEEFKGKEEVKEAARILKLMSEQETGSSLNFKGFIEGNHIMTGEVDVIVADGFSGNIALKSMEGLAKFYGKAMRHFLKSSLMARLAYLIGRPAFNSLRVRLDPRRYNGAVFLGLNGISVKSHGGTDAIGHASAISVAIDMAHYGFVDHVKEEVEHFAAQVQQISETA